jgi:pyruvate ferredoxin oxidoreductase gamma subunit
VIADASLIQDPAARVLEGVTDRTAVFVNTPDPPEKTREKFNVPGRLATLDLTGLALQRFGKASAVSAPLGAVACRLRDFKKESLRTAVEQELSHLNLTAAVVEKNVALASECFESAPVVPVLETTPADVESVPLWTPTYESPTKGTATIAAGANSMLRQTGGWRTFRPVLVPDKCNGCWLCFVYCPDGVISMTKDDLPLIDYDHCKGCQICVQECPTKALVAEREKEGAVEWRAR